MQILKESEIDGIVFSTHKDRLDIPYIHTFLSTKSYWAEHIPLSIVQRSIDNSTAIGVYVNNKQIGFARVVTDCATFGYLADVFIDENHRGKGLSKMLMTFILSLEALKSLRRIVLGTKDAHGLYAQFGFKSLGAPERFMEIHQPNLYNAGIQQTSFNHEHV